MWQRTIPWPSSGSGRPRKTGRRSSTSTLDSPGHLRRPTCTRIRPGTDAALLNTIINYVLVHKLYDEDYITTHTNALFLGHAAFDFKDGLFRGFTILQLLLGNVGKPGSGVNALRGEPNVQGACDMGVLNNYMPGYLNYPAHTEPTLAEYTKRNGTADSKFLVNTLKAFYGDAATPENDFAYAWLPKRSAAKDYGTMSIFESAHAGTMKMLWIVGQNPAGTMPNLNLTFEAMAKLETLVVQEIWETETATFWRRPGVDPKSISTEVILLPAPFFMEKNGTISNSGGLVQ